MATVAGIDVSYWKSTVDWGRVRAAGQAFAFVKASEGASYTDPTFGPNWSGTKSAGLLRGAFCYFHPSQDAAQQADLFISVVQATRDNGELPPVLDIEIPDGQDCGTILTRAKTWLDTVEQAFGRRPIIYSGYFFLRDNLCMPGGTPPDWSLNYPLWIAQYPNSYTPGMVPALPAGWPNWTIWQYTEAGQVDGVNARVDMNLFNGSIADLQQFAGAQIPAAAAFVPVAAPARPAVVAPPSAPAPNPAPAPAPASAPAAPAAPAAPRGTYTVKPGDSLYAIALRYGTTAAAIAAANKIANPNVIRVGQVLVIP
jgi:lysozyme